MCGKDLNVLLNSCRPGYEALKTSPYTWQGVGQYNLEVANLLGSYSSEYLHGLLILGYWNEAGRTMGFVPATFISRR